MIITIILFIIIFYYKPYISYTTKEMHINILLWYNYYEDGEIKERRYKILFKI